MRRPGLKMQRFTQNITFGIWVVSLAWGQLALSGTPSPWQPPEPEDDTYFPVTYTFHPPLAEGFVTSGLGYQETFKHDGVDYKHETNFDVYAIGYGVVAAVKECTEFQGTNCVYLRGKDTAESNYGYGHLVITEHPYASLPPWVTAITGIKADQSLFILYSHLEDVPEIPVGTRLSPGDKIATMGRSGNTYGNATIHLHFEFRIEETGSVSRWGSNPWIDYQWFKFTPINPELLEPLYGVNLRLWIPVKRYWVW